MGGEQSKTSSPNDIRRRRGEQVMTQAEVTQLLKQQKLIYEAQLQEITTQSRGMSPDEVKKILEKQRETYEEKFKQFQNRTSVNGINSGMAELAIEELLRAQKNEYEAKLRELTQNNNQPAPKPTMSATSIERTRSPYNYDKETLQNLKQSTSDVNHLYPNLSGPSQAFHKIPSPSCPPEFHNIPSRSCPPEFHNIPGPSTGTIPGYTYVNNNQFPLNNNVNTTGPHNALRVPNSESQRVQPSAPPAPDTKRYSRPNRDKSAPRTNVNNDNIDQQYNCITCRSRYGLYIFQCTNGHSSCKECKMRGRQCGICNNVITEKRNIALEGMIGEIKVPCANKNEGCKLFLKTKDMEIHAKECPFNDLPCPLRGKYGFCVWRGKFSQVREHFDKSHPENRAYVEKEMEFFNNQNRRSLYLVDMGPYNFLIHVVVDAVANKVYIAVQLIGTVTSASKWTYEVHMYNKEEAKKKYQHTDIVVSSKIPVEDLFRDSKCLCLPQSYVANFENRGIVNYKFFIKRGDEYIKKDGEPSNRNRNRRYGRGKGKQANE